MPRILLLPGDGVGPEVLAAARAVLDAVRSDLEYTERPVGLSALRLLGVPYEEDLIDVARAHDAVLLGAVGGEQRPDEQFEARPEAALFALRQELDLYLNLRPIRAAQALADRSPLRPERVDGTDFLIARELTGGLYFGTKTSDDNGAVDTCEYSRFQIERTVRAAFELARKRRGRLASIDKANVLSTSILWRRIVIEVATEYGEIDVEHLLVDNAAMQLLTRAQSFDVVVTENMFGDILSDEASLLSGGLGMLPSASLGDRSPSLYEPAHGSAPDIAGQGIANPCAAILSAALLLRHALGDDAGALAVEQAVDDALEAGFLSRDVGGTADTAAVTTAVLEALGRRVPIAAGT